MAGINTTMDARAAQWYYVATAIGTKNTAAVTAGAVPANLLSATDLPGASITVLDGGGTVPALSQSANSREQTIMGSTQTIKFPDPPSVDDVVFDLLYVPTNALQVSLIAAEGSTTLRSFIRKQTNGSLWTAHIFDGLIGSVSLGQASNGADMLSVTVVRQGKFTVVNAT